MKKEDYLFRGGYLKNGSNWAVDGDKVRFKIGYADKVKENWTYGYLYFNTDDGCFLVRGNEEDANPYYLWEIAEWQLIRKELFILNYNNGDKKRFCVSSSDYEGFIDEEIYQYLGISEEQFLSDCKKK